MFRLFRPLRLLKSVIRPRALALALPVILYGLYEHNNKCLFGFGGATLEKNKIQDRTTVAEYPANFPIEDRFTSYQLTNTPGYMTAVFDGHGGWQMVHSFPIVV